MHFCFKTLSPQNSVPLELKECVKLQECILFLPQTLTGGPVMTRVATIVYNLTKQEEIKPTGCQIVSESPCTLLENLREAHHCFAL